MIAYPLQLFLNLYISSEYRFMNNTNTVDNGFTAEEIKLIADTLAERFGKPVDTEHADIELKKATEESS